ncbi:glycosyltransferase involved in cell wall biosynthesis [Alkalibaculum bacchi]|uniref:Glycosyltransferase involved in cell wall biosynthesis n=1 Tax=Alkalibaculum bacchi TaxID=645887 RepID=A0A366IDM4_9FIRM|nr:glycosyltransferase family 4 protein [Alkalibaculum bacchi]RBP69095.1 glycosyltransferase involved in cell wall biosynthesis [Alkalibaculum bacchi]
MNIWIINHYAMPPKYEMRVRNHKMAKYLMNNGHNVKIISASTLHNTDINLLENSKLKFVEKSYEGLEFVHIKTLKYQGNGIKRIINHLQFSIRFLLNYKKISNKPDIIICDLGALFALFPYFVSRNTKSKFILEVRDLWPESIVEFLGYSRNNPLIKILYYIEEWIYIKSDNIVFSMAGGKDYLINKGLDKKVSLDKVEHITNGVDLEEFEENMNKYEFQNEKYNNCDSFKVVYTGSIRIANNIEFLIEVARELKNFNSPKIDIFIFGDGSNREKLINLCNELNLDNIHFMGQVDKKYIPNILSKSDLNILHYKQTKTWKYGGSQNKLSEYIASKKPILSTINMNYNPIIEYKCGEVIPTNNPKEVAEMIKKISSLDKDSYQKYCDNAKEACQNLDYKLLTRKMQGLF